MLSPLSYAAMQCVFWPQQHKQQQSRIPAGTLKELSVGFVSRVNLAALFLLFAWNFVLSLGFNLTGCKCAFLTHERGSTGDG